MPYGTVSPAFCWVVWLESLTSVEFVCVQEKTTSLSFFTGAVVSHQELHQPCCQASRVYPKEKEDKYLLYYFRSQAITTATTIIKQRSKGTTSTVSCSLFVSFHHCINIHHRIYYIHRHLVSYFLYV